MAVKQHMDLFPFNTFGVRAYAERMAIVDSIDTLVRTAEENRGVRKLLMGGGSNLLFVRDYHGLILKNELKGFSIRSKDDDSVLIDIGAGEIWHDTVLRCIENGWGGIENLSLIPGRVGAAPIQNIGAYGVELKDVLFEVTGLHIETGIFETLSNSQCRFGYRDSIFKSPAYGDFVVTGLCLRLSLNPVVNISYGDIQKVLQEVSVETPTIRDVSKAVCRIRSSKLPDPSQLGNAGSFFKNPVIDTTVFEALQQEHPSIAHYKTNDPGLVKIPAAWLIEQCGWKGKRVGNTGCHALQPLVIVNYGNATGAEIWEHAQRVIRSVEDRFGVKLTPEVRIID